MSHLFVFILLNFDFPIESFSTAVSDCNNLLYEPMAIHGHVDNCIHFLALSSLPMITQVVTPVSVSDVPDQKWCPKFPAAFRQFSERNL